LFYEQVNENRVANRHAGGAKMHKSIFDVFSADGARQANAATSTFQRTLSRCILGHFDLFRLCRNHVHADHKDASRACDLGIVESNSDERRKEFKMTASKGDFAFVAAAPRVAIRALSFPAVFFSNAMPVWSQSHWSFADARADSGFHLLRESAKTREPAAAHLRGDLA
jgi:hypothetical protein